MEEQTQSIYEMIGAPARIDEEFSAINPSEEICLALKLRKDQPVLARKRVSFDKKGQKMEYTMCYYRGDLYSYTISTSHKL